MKLLLALSLLLTGCATSPKATQYPRNVNGAMPALGQHDPRVVFIGDQTSYAFVSAANNPNWINASTNGPETTGHMLGRFEHDVLGQHPDVVQIWGGAADIASLDWLEPSGTGSPADIDTVGNVAQMAQLAEDAGIKVLIGTIPQAGDGSLLDADINEYDYYVLVQSVGDPLAGEPMESARLVDYEITDPDDWLSLVSTSIQSCECGGIR